MKIVLLSAGSGKRLRPLSNEARSKQFLKMLIKHYDKLPKISFDYAVVEKAKDIIVTPYDGYWKDLGTWNSRLAALS